MVTDASKKISEREEKELLDEAMRQTEDGTCSWQETGGRSDCKNVLLTNIRRKIRQHGYLKGTSQKAR